MKNQRELRDAIVFDLLNEKPKKKRKAKKVVKPMPMPKAPK